MNVYGKSQLEKISDLLLSNVTKNTLRTDVNGKQRPIKTYRYFRVTFLFLQVIVQDLK